MLAELTCLLHQHWKRLAAVIRTLRDGCTASFGSSLLYIALFSSPEEDERHIVELCRIREVTIASLQACCQPKGKAVRTATDQVADSLRMS
jgi:hypothetical protein